MSMDDEKLHALIYHLMQSCERYGALAEQGPRGRRRARPRVTADQKALVAYLAAHYQR